MLFNTCNTLFVSSLSIEGNVAMHSRGAIQEVKASQLWQLCLIAKVYLFADADEVSNAGKMSDLLKIDMHTN
jgi:hypothetical protein